MTCNGPSMFEFHRCNQGGGARYPPMPRSTRLHTSTTLEPEVHWSPHRSELVSADVTKCLAAAGVVGGPG